MTITAHHVAPEELMAFLDGELSAAESQGVSVHVDQCAECANVAEQLRRTSRALAAWKVPAIPEKVEKSVTELAAKKESGLDLGKPRLFIRASFWTWKRYAVMSAGAVSALLILAAVLTPNLMRMRVTPGAASYVAAQRSDKGRGTLGTIYTDGPPPSAGKPAPPRSGPVPLSSRGVATDSNGILHGLGDHAEQSLSVDGQPMTEQQSKVFSNGAPSPMIARTVSLSIMVKDFATSRSSLDMILARYRGYSAQLNASTTENAPRSLQASLRIPAPALSAAVGDLKRLGRVENESQSGEEVTRQHADLIARLKNARDTEQRLREILQQRTGKIGEVLQVEQEIARVRGEIESMEADQKALEHRVDFATVELQLTEEFKAQLNPPAPSISTRIHNAFVAGYQNASATVLGILLFFAEYGPALLIWLAILGLPVVMVWRRYRRISSTV